ncbi:heparinase II/III domain-containing protein [Oerskovia turbata]
MLDLLDSIGCDGGDVVAVWPAARLDERTAPTLRTSGALDAPGDSALAVVSFEGESQVHDFQAHFALAGAAPQGLAIRYRTSGWQALQYLAVGWQQDGQYFHVKVRHARQGAWNTAHFFVHDLVLRAQGSPRPAAPRIDNVRFFVKGTPAPGGARLEVARIALLDKRSATSSTIEFTPRLHDAVEVAASSIVRADKAAASREDLEAFRAEGQIPLLPGLRVDWAPAAISPVDPHDNPTLRFSWNALHPLALLAIEADRVGDETALRSVVEIAVQWITLNMHASSPDPRYAWYDHGAAERLSSLLIVLRLAEPLIGGYARALICDAVLQHARLLANEAFYAANQVSRHHNHAWFQDIALLIAAEAFRSREAEAWRALAIERLEDQFSTLICADGPFSVFTENSIGYHSGVTSLVRITALLADADSSARFSEIADRMDSFSRLFSYPDGTVPAQGDTYRARPTASPRKPTLRHESVVLPRAGYAVAHGSDEGAPYSLVLMNSGLNTTHKHEDNASFTLWFAGVEWLTDPSFYSHAYTEPVPAYLRGRWAHNAVVVESSTYSIDPEDMRCVTSGHAEGQRYRFAAEHTAYAQSTVRRVIEGRTDDLTLSIVDHVSGTGPRPAHCVVHLAPGVRCVATTSSDDSVVYRLEHELATRRVALRFPRHTPRRAVGEGDSPEATSVAGYGFREHVATTSIVVPLAAGHDLRWSISAV